MTRYTTGKVWLLCCLLCMGLDGPVRADGKFYSTDNGLCSTLVNLLFQDSRGFVWTATEYGLSRFDGVRFSTYRRMAGDSTTVKNNYVRTLFEDSRHDLLVGCMDGLMRYDPETDTFSELPMIRAGKRVYPHVTQMRELHNGEVWIATSGQGLFRLDEGRTVAHSLDDRLHAANYNFLQCFYEDSHYNLWIGTEGNGLICYLPQSGETRVYRKPQVKDNNISAILEDRQGHLFNGTQKEGLACYDRTADRFLPIPCADGSRVSVFCLSLVDNRLLVGTDGQGVWVYDPLDKILKKFEKNNSPLDFSNGKVHALLEDREKNLWVGLFQKGVALIPRQENPFEYYGRRSIHYNPIGEACVMSLFSDSKSRLWVGTDGEGLYELSADGQRVNHYLAGVGMGGHTILCICEDSEGNFWLGSYTGGLMRLDLRTGHCDYPLPLQNEKIFSIVEDRKKNLYIGTFSSGFYQYNLLTRELRHYESSKDETGDLGRNELANDWVNSLLCDRDGHIWIAHYQGVSCFNPKTGSFLDCGQRNTLVTGCVGYCLLEDASGHIWAGTTEGLWRIDKRTGETEHFTVLDGLPSNVVCGLCEDGHQDIWISTYRGLSHYDVRAQRFINYYAGDGLQGNEFMHGAFCKDSIDGKLYFGGMDGITAFYPEAVGVSPRETEVWITEFYIFDRPVHKQTLSGGQPVIGSAVQDASYFRLSHSDNTFSIVFSTLRFSNAEQITYQYKIEELDRCWLPTEPAGGGNRVTYNNLPPGKYTFSVRAVNHGNVSAGRTVVIEILPPWYETWWAYAIYILFFLLLVAGVVNYVRSRIRHRREIMKREHAEQLNEAKLQFFINISHEIRTPMTLIINPLEKLLADHRESPLYGTYLMIYRNAQRILRLINQLMDIRKLDKGQMHMKFRETDMVGFILDVMQPFGYMAQKKGIRFDFEHDMPELKVWVDLNNFDKVLMNILSNAFKYTPEEGEILVRLQTGRDAARHDALRDYFEITVTDNGIGIDKDKINRIFERFYQIDNDVTNSNFGTGIGLHLSRSLVQLHHGVILAENREDKQGSRFIIRLPMGSAHLRVDELEVQETERLQPVVLPLRQSAVQPLAAERPEEERRIKAKSNLKVLVVEDEEEIRDYLREVLSDDYRVTVCGNGREAYELMLADAPDAVICDVMMPEMDGLTLCRKMKQNTNINHIPVILLTARSKPEDKLEGMETGADAYMVKPFSTELLKKTVANLIANRRLLKSKFSGAQQQLDRVEKIVMKSSDEKLMNRIMKVVNDNLSNPKLSVEMLAEEVGLSRVHVHRKLKELTNLSTRDFIKNIRLQQAAALMQSEPGLTVSEVAYAVGFSGLSHFSSSFREKYGLSPTEYMIQQKREKE